jgi:hypothetical protein
MRWRVDAVATQSAAVATGDACTPPILTALRAMRMVEQRASMIGDEECDAGFAGKNVCAELWARR